MYDEDDYESRSDRRRTQAIASFTVEHLDSIINALHNHSDRMATACEQAMGAWRAGQNDPAVAAAQDASMMTHTGYLHSASLFAGEAAKCRMIVRVLRGLDEAEDVDPGIVTRLMRDERECERGERELVQWGPDGAPGTRPPTAVADRCGPGRG